MKKAPFVTFFPRGLVRVILNIICSILVSHTVILYHVTNLNIHTSASLALVGCYRRQSNGFKPTDHFYAYVK